MSRRPGEAGEGKGSSSSDEESDEEEEEEGKRQDKQPGAKFAALEQFQPTRPFFTTADGSYKEGMHKAFQTNMRVRLKTHLKEANNLATVLGDQLLIAHWTLESMDEGKLISVPITVGSRAAIVAGHLMGNGSTISKGTSGSTLTRYAMTEAPMTKVFKDQDEKRDTRDPEAHMQSYLRLQLSAMLTYVGGDADEVKFPGYPIMAKDAKCGGDKSRKYLIQALRALVDGGVPADPELVTFLESHMACVNCGDEEWEAPVAAEKILLFPDKDMQLALIGQVTARGEGEAATGKRKGEAILNAASGSGILDRLRVVVSKKGGGSAKSGNSAGAGSGTSWVEKKKAASAVAAASAAAAGASASASTSTSASASASASLTASASASASAAALAAAAAAAASALASKAAVRNGDGPKVAGVSDVTEDNLEPHFRAISVVGVGHCLIIGTLAAGIFESDDIENESSTTRLNLKDVRAILELEATDDIADHFVINETLVGDSIKYEIDMDIETILQLRKAVARHIERSTIEQKWSIVSELIDVTEGIGRTMLNEIASLNREYEEIQERHSSIIDTGGGSSQSQRDIDAMDECKNKRILLEGDHKKIVAFCSRLKNPGPVTQVNFFDYTRNSDYSFAHEAMSAVCRHFMIEENEFFDADESSVGDCCIATFLTLVWDDGRDRKDTGPYPMYFGDFLIPAWERYISSVLDNRSVRIDTYTTPGLRTGVCHYHHAIESMDIRERDGPILAVIKAADVVIPILNHGNHYWGLQQYSSSSALEPKVDALYRFGFVPVEDVTMQFGVILSKLQKQPSVKDATIVSDEAAKTSGAVDTSSGAAPSDNGDPDVIPQSLTRYFTESPLTSTERRVANAAIEIAKTDSTKGLDYGDFLGSGILITAKKLAMLQPDVFISDHVAEMLQFVISNPSRLLASTGTAISLDSDSEAQDDLLSFRKSEEIRVWNINIFPKMMQGAVAQYDWDSVSCFTNPSKPTKIPDPFAKDRNLFFGGVHTNHFWAYDVNFKDLKTSNQVDVKVMDSMKHKYENLAHAFGSWSTDLAKQWSRRHTDLRQVKNVKTIVEVVQSRPTQTSCHCLLYAMMFQIMCLDDIPLSHPQLVCGGLERYMADMRLKVALLLLQSLSISPDDEIDAAGRKLLSDSGFVEAKIDVMSKMVAAMRIRHGGGGNLGDSMDLEIDDGSDANPLTTAGSSSEADTGGGSKLEQEAPSSMQGSGPAAPAPRRRGRPRKLQDDETTAEVQGDANATATAATKGTATATTGAKRTRRK